MNTQVKFVLMMIVLMLGFSLNGPWLWLGLAFCFMGGILLGNVIVEYIQSRK